jgi:hypothetical protein
MSKSLTKSMTTNNANQELTPKEIAEGGQKIYFDELKDKLEKEHMGEYAAIDVEQKKYQVDPDGVTAIEKARKAFGEKLFYIVHIGNLRRPSMNFTTQKYAWDF